MKNPNDTVFIRNSHDNANNITFQKYFSSEEEIAIKSGKAEKNPIYIQIIDGNARDMDFTQFKTADGRSLKRDDAKNKPDYKFEFQYSELDNANMSGLDLRGSRFIERTNAVSADFSGSNLSSAKFTGGSFNSANFSGAELSNATLGEFAKFNGANFSNANLANSTFQGVEIAGAQFPEDPKLLKGMNIDLNSIQTMTNVAEAKKQAGFKEMSDNDLSQVLRENQQAFLKNYNEANPEKLEKLGIKKEGDVFVVPEQAGKTAKFDLPVGDKKFSVVEVDRAVTLTPKEVNAESLNLKKTGIRLG